MTATAQRPLGAKSILTDIEYRQTYAGWTRLVITPFRTKRAGQSVILYRVHTIDGGWWHTARFVSAAVALERIEAAAVIWSRQYRRATPQTSFLV